MKIPKKLKLESLSLNGLDLRVAFTFHALLHLYLPAYLHGSLCVDCRGCFGGFIIFTEEQTTSILRCKHESFALSSGLPVSYCDANAFATALSQIRKKLVLCQHGQKRSKFAWKGKRVQSFCFMLRPPPLIK